MATTVVDATEYAETELFAEQAERKLAAWRAAGGLPDAAEANRLAEGLAKIRAAVGRKAPHAEVVDEASAAIAVVQKALAGAVPESIRGAVLASDRADQAIAAEEIVGEYRIGVVAGPARPIFRRDGATLVAAPAAAGGRGLRRRGRAREAHQAAAARRGRRARRRRAGWARRGAARGALG